jgi:translation initiation factor 1
MTDRSSRTVYSTGAGRVCPTCGWPTRDCKCSSQFVRDEPLPARIVAKLRIERSGRAGKTVTVVYDLPRNQLFLKELVSELKRACGAGGAVVENTVEIQGDLRDRIRGVLAKKGWTVKGWTHSGGGVILVSGVRPGSGRPEPSSRLMAFQAHVVIAQDLATA